jgi:hypothetical protein
MLRNGVKLVSLVLGFAMSRTSQRALSPYSSRQSASYFARTAAA